jgi:ribonuclease HI
VNGPDRGAAAALQPYRATVHALLGQLREVTVRWIPRHKNSAADALSQRAAALPQNESTDDLLAD